MWYTEAAEVLEESLSKELIGLTIFLLWGSLLEVQEGGDIPNGISEEQRARNCGIFHVIPTYKCNYFQNVIKMAM